MDCFWVLVFFFHICGFLYFFFLFQSWHSFILHYAVFLFVTQYFKPFCFLYLGFLVLQLSFLFFVLSLLFSFSFESLPALVFECSLFLSSAQHWWAFLLFLWYGLFALTWSCVQVICFTLAFLDLFLLCSVFLPCFVFPCLIFYSAPFTLLSMVLVSLLLPLCLSCSFIFLSDFWYCFSFVSSLCVLPFCLLPVCVSCYCVFVSCQCVFSFCLIILLCLLSWLLKSIPYLLLGMTADALHSYKDMFCSKCHPETQSGLVTLM